MGECVRACLRSSVSVRTRTRVNGRVCEYGDHRRFVPPPNDGTRRVIGRTTGCSQQGFFISSFGVKPRHYLFYGVSPIKFPIVELSYHFYSCLRIFSRYEAGN